MIAIADSIDRSGSPSRMVRRARLRRRLAGLVLAALSAVGVLALAAMPLGALRLFALVAGGAVAATLVAGVCSLMIADWGRDRGIVR